MDNRFKLFMLVLILFTLGNSSDAFIILLGQNRGLSVLQILLMLLTFNLIYSVLAGPLGALSDRIGRRRLIIGGWIAYGLVYLGFALSKTGWEIWTFFGLYGIYYAATEGSAKAFIADLVPADRRGTAYGLYNAAIGLMAFPASAIAGLLWQGAFGWNGFGPSARSSLAQLWRLWLASCSGGSFRSRSHRLLRRKNEWRISATRFDIILHLTVIVRSGHTPILVQPTRILPLPDFSL